MREPGDGFMKNQPLIVAICDFLCLLFSLLCVSLFKKICMFCVFFSFFFLNEAFLLQPHPSVSFRPGRRMLSARL